MKPIGLSKIEVSIYVEYIQNYINDSLSGFHEKCAGEIKRNSSVKAFNALSRNALMNMTYSQVVQPYVVFIENLVIDINNKLCEHFDLEQSEISTLSFDGHIYDYHLNCELIREYGKTEKLSMSMEKLINKTLDFTCLNQMQAPVIEKIIDSLSFGSLFMSIFGLDSSIHRAENKLELCKVLKGIGKNINIRVGNLLKKQYAALIYQFMENDQEDFSYEQVI